MTTESDEPSGAATDRQASGSNQAGNNGHYILSTGEAGAARLAILGRVLQPTTEAFLSRAGLGAGMRTLDLGCGGGDVTRLMAGVVGDA
ncbi:MAG TPA: hypothetical protein VHU17_02330, partial [Acidimicrobiales bacterium]|nr:hypothetical protein [Acidimicrobiales bacterium]